MAWILNTEYPSNQMWFAVYWVIWRQMFHLQFWGHIRKNAFVLFEIIFLLQSVCYCSKHCSWKWQPAEIISYISSWSVRLFCHLITCTTSIVNTIRWDVICYVVYKENQGYFQAKTVSWWAFRISIFAIFLFLCTFPQT
jgi:hypothetical protein